MEIGNVIPLKLKLSQKIDSKFAIRLGKQLMQFKLTMSRNQGRCDWA